MRPLFLFVFLFLFVPQQLLCAITNKQIIQSLQHLSRAKKSAPGKPLTPIQKIARQAYTAWEDIAEAWNFIRERKNQIHFDRTSENVLKAFLSQLQKKNETIKTNKKKLIFLNRDLPDSDRTDSDRTFWPHLIRLIRKTQEYLTWITQEIDRVKEAIKEQEFQLKEAIQEQEFQLTVFSDSTRSHRARTVPHDLLSHATSKRRTRSLPSSSRSTSHYSRPKIRQRRSPRHPTSPASANTHARSTSPRPLPRPVSDVSQVPLVHPTSPTSDESRASRSHSPEARGGGPSEHPSPRTTSRRSSSPRSTASISSPLPDGFEVKENNIFLFPLEPSKQSGNNCGVCALMNAKAILEHLNAGNPIHTVKLPTKKACDHARHIFNKKTQKYDDDQFGSIYSEEMGTVAQQLGLADHDKNFKVYPQAQLIYVSPSLIGLEIKKSPFKGFNDLNELHRAYQNKKAIIVIFLTEGKIDGDGKHTPGHYVCTVYQKDTSNKLLIYRADSEYDKGENQSDKITEKEIALGERLRDGFNAYT